MAKLAASSKCFKCGKPAAISLNYMQQDLCQSHFTEMFESRVKRTAREYRMLRKGEKIAVALFQKNALTESSLSTKYIDEPGKLPCITTVLT